MADVKETKKVATATKTTTVKKDVAPKATAVKTVAPKATVEKIVAPKATVAKTTKSIETKKEIVKTAPAPKKAAKVESKKTLKVTLIRSTICALPNHVKTVKALGLRKLNSSNVLVDNDAVRGMIFTVKHLIRVEEI